MRAPAPDALIAKQSGPLRGRIEVPGDKSISHRALILGALAEGETIVHGLLESDDVLATAHAVGKFGAHVWRSSDGIWRVRGAEWRSPDGPVDCGNSGTAARLLMGAAAGFPIEVTFTGDASLKTRPMKRVLEPLRTMGAFVEPRETLPVMLRGGDISGIAFRNSYASAQVKSAVLLAGLHAAGPAEVFEPQPTRDHTEQMLRGFGCDVEVSDLEGGKVIRLGANRRLSGCSLFVPGDPSSAAFPLVAALITQGSEVTVRAMLDTPLRSGLFDTLLGMGADIEFHNRRMVGGMSVVDVTARSSALAGVDVPASRAPAMIDEYPILAVAAAFAHGTTVMRGLGELRVKECDRLAAIVEGLAACGVEAQIEDDILLVVGCGSAPPGAAHVKTHSDHRIAMSFLTLGFGAASPVSVDSASMIATSFPGFADLMRSIRASLARPQDGDGNDQSSSADARLQA